MKQTFLDFVAARKENEKHLKALNEAFKEEDVDKAPKAEIHGIVETEFGEECPNKRKTNFKVVANKGAIFLIEHIIHYILLVIPAGVVAQTGYEGKNSK